MLTRRTDLALEAAEGLSPSGGARGVRQTGRQRDGFSVTEVEVLDRAGAEAVGKPVGRYITVDLSPLRRRERESFRRGAQAVARELSGLLPPGDGPVLAVCLGNRRVTPDAVGPLVHDGLLVTRHLVEGVPEEFGAFRSVAALAPGVLAATGVESGDMAAAVVRAVRPQCVVAVDALAARSVGRLCATVQLSDTGISPGSGVGNHRQALNTATLGVPVVAVGVPTVVDGATLCADLLAEAGAEKLDPKALGGEEARLYVTPRDIDVRVREAAKLVAYALSLALQPGLTVEDLEGLLE